MRKNVLLLLFLLTGLPAARAQYQTPGTGVRWTLAQLVAASGGYVTGSGAAYQFTDTIRLSARDTLDLTTNATVRVADRALFYVDGVLRVTPPDSVVFTAQATALPWLGMQLSATSGGSVLRRAVVERSAGVRVVDAAVEVTDCVFRFNVSTVNSRLINSAALALSGNRALIQRCRFVRNARAGVNSPSNRPTAPVIEDCVFLENDTENGNYPQINLGVGNPLYPTRIERCRVIGSVATNMAGGIGISNLLGSSALTQVVVRRNIVRNNRYGVAVIGSNIQSYITQNLIEDNNVNPNAQTGGSGLNFQGTTTQTGVVSRNIIRGNLYGVTMLRSSATQPGPLVSFGNAASTDSTDVGRNRLTGNGNGGQVYDFYNNQPGPVKAQYNDWGTASAAVIESHIFHQTDEAALGLVEFSPFLTVTGTRDASPRLAVAAYPNPATETVTFTVAGPALVQLVLTDVTGRTVADRQLKPLQGHVTLALTGLASGLYAYRLVQDGAVGAGRVEVSH